MHTGSLTVREILDAAGFAPDDHVLVEHQHGGSASSRIFGESVPLCADLRLRTRARKKIYHVVVNGRPREVLCDVLTSSRPRLVTETVTDAA